MAEKVEKLGVHREKDFMYYVKDASVWKVQRKQPHVPKGRTEKVAQGTFKMDSEFIYFVDRDGDVSRAKRAVGGQKRKKTVIQPPGLKPRRSSPRAAPAPAARAKTRPRPASKTVNKTASRAANKKGPPSRTAKARSAVPLKRSSTKAGTAKAKTRSAMGAKAKGSARGGKAKGRK